MKMKLNDGMKNWFLPFLLLMILSTSLLFLAATRVGAADGNDGDDGSNSTHTDTDHGTSTTTTHGDDDNNDNNDNHDGHDDGTGDHHDDEARHEEREVKVSKSGREVEIESELKNGTNKDKVELKIKADEDIEVRLKYKSKSDSTEYKVEFRVEFREIIEYSENGTADSGYQPDSDTLVTRYRLQDHLGNDINYTTQTINGALVHVFEVITTDGVFKVIFKLPEAVLNVSSGVVLTPSALKIDVEINNFPYQGNDTSLALLTKVKTKTKYELKDHTEHEDLGFSQNETEVELPAPDNSTSGFFSWAETAIADGQTISVVNTQPLPDSNDDGDNDHEEGETSRRIYFSFIAVQPSHIYWDPKVGVLTAPYQALFGSLGEEAANEATTFSFEFIAVLATITLLGILSTKRRLHRRRK